MKEVEKEQKQAEMNLKEIKLKKKDYDVLIKDTGGIMNVQLHWHMKTVEEIATRPGL